MAHTSACNRNHALGTQLCRWLLQRLDRQSGDELQITQERIAGMLSVRREGIMGAAMKLQRAGQSSYGCGRMQVLDRRGLEEQSCECYGVVAAVPLVRCRIHGLGRSPMAAGPEFAA